MLNLHPAVAPIAFLLLVMTLTSGVVIWYKQPAQVAKTEQANPWKTRQELRGTQYHEVKYREATPADVEIQKRNAESQMRSSGRL